MRSATELVKTALPSICAQRFLSRLSPAPEDAAVVIGSDCCVGRELSKDAWVL